MTKDQWIQRAKALLWDCRAATDSYQIADECELLVKQGGGYDVYGGETPDSPLRWPEELFWDADEDECDLTEFNKWITSHVPVSSSVDELIDAVHQRRAEREAYDMRRLDANLHLLDRLRDVALANPELRFWQLVRLLNPGNKDRFYEEPWVTLASYDAYRKEIADE